MRYLRYIYRAFGHVIGLPRIRVTCNWALFDCPLFWLDRFRRDWFRCETCGRRTHVDLGRALSSTRMRDGVSEVYGWCESCKDGTLRLLDAMVQRQAKRTD